MPASCFSTFSMQNHSFLNLMSTRNFKFYRQRRVSSQLATFFKKNSSSVICRNAKHYNFNFVSKAEVNRPHGSKPNQKPLITQNMQTRPGYAEKTGPDNLWTDKLNDFSQMADSNDSSSLQQTNSDFFDILVRIWTVFWNYFVRLIFSCHDRNTPTDKHLWPKASAMSDTKASFRFDFNESILIVTNQ